MRVSFFAAMTVVCAASAGAVAGQTTQTPSTTGSTAASANQTMTLTGCVGGGADASDSLLLFGASLVSVGAQTPGQTITPSPAAGAVGTAGSSSTGVAGTTSVGTTGSSTSAGTASASTAGFATAGASAATAAGSASIGTYRLSGYDVSALRGKRVRIVGSLAEPSPTGVSSANALRTGPREFRVQSVQPVSGSCPQP